MSGQAVGFSPPGWDGADEDVRGPGAT